MEVSIDATQLINKINFARSSLFLKRNEMIEENFPFPTSPTEEQDAVQRIIYSYLKKRFTGCKLRASSQTFSLRLDGEIHKKVKRVKEKVMGDDIWKKWFQENHREIYRMVERHDRVFRGDYIEAREKEGRDFLYIPLQTNRIRYYSTEGTMGLFTFLEEAYQKEKSLADMYDQVVSLMEGEILRKQEETRLRIEADKIDYITYVKNSLLKRITRVNREGTTLEDKLAVKMYDWCTEQGIQPAYALEPTYERVLKQGMNVDIIVRDEDSEEDWYVVPTFGGYQLPEGFTLMDGYGDITGFDKASPRSREGQSPVVVIRHMYCQYDVNFWRPYFPEHYQEILEATRIFTLEAETEVAQAEEERKEMERREREERDRRRDQELKDRLEREALDQKNREERQARDAAEQEAIEAAEKARLQALKDELLGQLTAAQTAEQATEPDPKTFPDGIYLKANAIPLERYVTVYGGRVRRFANRTAAIDHLRNVMTWAQLEERNVRDYYNIDSVVETIHR